MVSDRQVRSARRSGTTGALPYLNLGREWRTLFGPVERTIAPL
jgi:hypothetical protein